MSMYVYICFLILSLSALCFASPTVTVKNGTYEGFHLPQYGEDAFLGIPYAQPPTEKLRFVAPQSLNQTWTGERLAKNYSDACHGFGPASTGLAQSEDCLYLNVVRPAGCEGQKLPVGFWIHGGGYTEGSASQPLYNMSALVRNSVKSEKPIIGVSINYRLSTWGFLGGNQIQFEGNTNNGLRDQRLALHWVQENIEAFGGDPNKVTIFGESAGASSVGFHLTAFNGRNDSLFRGAIMESGSPIYYYDLATGADLEPQVEYLAKKAGCVGAIDKLKCLRKVPADKLLEIIKGRRLLREANAYIDGDFIARYTSQQLVDGDFVHVPVIIGANTDEGTSFSPKPVTNTSIFAEYIENHLMPTPKGWVKRVLEAYPNTAPHRSLPYGSQWTRSAAYWGDLIFIANRRRTCEQWAAHGLPVYCYRFNALPAGVPAAIGVTHGTELAMVFDDELGLGWPFGLPNPFHGQPQEYFQLAKFIGASWSSFMTDLDPNSYRKGNVDVDLGHPPVWPKYDNANPQNMLFEGDKPSHIEADTFRKEAINFILSGYGTVYFR